MQFRSSNLLKLESPFCTSYIPYHFLGNGILSSEKGIPLLGVVHIVLISAVLQWPINQAFLSLIELMDL